MSIQQKLSLKRNSGRRLTAPLGPLSEERPHYYFDFSLGTSFSREAIDVWPEITPFQGQKFLIDASKFAALAGRPLGPLEADWLRVALALYAVDRFALRRPAGDCGPTFWRRWIHVVLPVADVSKWRNATPELLAALTFLTEDEWHFEFVSRSFRYDDEEQKFEPISHDALEWVSLFSGGLDSATGAIQHLTASMHRGLLVSGNTHSQLKDGQEAFIAELRTHFPQRFDWLAVHYGPPIILEQLHTDSSQRCRGWIHVAMGLLAAHLAGLDRLYVFENGIGAFNLPCDSSQFGSQGSRAMHPLYLHRISAVASELLGRKMDICNPFLFSTKGEMVGHSAVKAISPILTKTFSCETFPNYNEHETQCGVCASCLIRRAALFGLPDFDDRPAYSWDVLSRGMPSTVKRMTGLIKLDQFSTRLKEWLNASEPWDTFVTENPDYAILEDELSEALNLSPAAFQTGFMELHTKFLTEWKRFERHMPRSHESELVLIP